MNSARRRAHWRLIALFSGILVSSGQSASREAQAGAGPLAPAEALASLELEPGYRIELAAAEPLIAAPVAIAFDERGRLFVVENRGYPGPLEGVAGGDAAGVVALLEDTDLDGRFDKRTEFARNLSHPNGVMPWDGGVFVSAAPDLLYLKDLTGDGVADERRIVLTGFDDSRTPQIRFSHPTFGLDNRVYLTSGLTGGRVSSPEHPERAPVTFANSDSRFDPFTRVFELTGGQSQYGLTFDDYGRRFTCSNRRPVMQVVLEPRYLRRNRFLAASESVADVSPAGAAAPVWPISGDTTTASFMPSLMGAPHAGTFTAASGVHIHRGDALPAGHRDSIFVCESAQNLVQRQVRSPDGVTFTSRPAQSGRDFLSSRDTWFRPVFAANGPDGALYIVDMYRKVIDHPQYVPEQTRALLDFQAGKERGRIYRVAARDWRPERKPIDLGRLGADDLAQTLEHPNAWWRETAQRLIVERRLRVAVPPLRTLVRDGRSETARIHALWTLDGLDALDPPAILRALNDPHPAVRENAVHAAESRLGASGELIPAVLRLAGDADDRVRFRVALALGETADRRRTAALASIARRDGAQPWMRAAVLSSVGERADDFLRAFVDAAPDAPGVRAAVLQDLGQLFGAAQSSERCLDLILEITGSDADRDWQPAALSGLAQGLRARESSQQDRSPFMTMLAAGTEQARTARQRVDLVLSRSVLVALDADAPLEQRLGAIRLLGHTDHATAGARLQGLLAPHHPSGVQLAAVKALSHLPEPAAAASLLDSHVWQAFTPHVREAVLSGLLAEERHTFLLLDALERGTVPVTAVGPLRRSRLTTHRNVGIQERSRALFAGAEATDRMQVYARLRPSILSRTASATRGQEVFAGHCAPCHGGGAAGQLGPDLSGIRNQPADAILLHVLVPDYEITPGYQSYSVETRDRRTLFGRLESEAPNSVTFRDGASQQHAILRRDLLSMSASPRSLMPSELERVMSEQDLADVIAYLKADATTK